MLWIGSILGVKAQETSAFPYPDIPDTLRTPEQRMRFLLANYWCHYDFDDTTPRNRRVGEQGFVDFVHLMQYADSATCAIGASALDDSVAQNEQRRLFVDSLTTYYLADRHSPVRDDEVYAHLLRAQAAHLSKDNYQLSIINYQLSALSHNRRGTVAANFRLPDGRWLHEAEAPLTLLVFYDPDCTSCQELMARMSNDKTLKAWTDQLHIIYIKEDESPDAWRLYHLPSLPSLYLLDSGKRVLVKDGTLENVVSTLQTLNHRPS